MVNAIFNAEIIHSSGSHHPILGKDINEQVGFDVEVFLKGMNNFDGSTITTGINYLQYNVKFRKTGAAVLTFFENRWNLSGMRREFRKWRQLLPIILTAEDLPQFENHVKIPDSWYEPIIVHHPNHSNYAKKGIARCLRKLPEILSPLPVESITELGFRGSESHILETTQMRTDSSLSIYDRNQIHHTSRNLVIVGSSVFPSSVLLLI